MKGSSQFNSILHPALPTEVTSGSRTTNNNNNNNNNNNSLSPRLKLAETPKSKSFPLSPRGMDEAYAKPPPKAVIDLTMPDPEAIDYAIANYVYKQLSKCIANTEDETRDAPRAELTLPEIYDETAHPVDKDTMPVWLDFSDMLNFIQIFQKVGDVHPTAMVLSIFFLEKLLETNPSITFNFYSWKRLLMGCMVVSTKVYEELSVRLTDFLNSKVFPFMTVDDLRSLESTTLEYLGYNIEWTQSDYTKTLLKLDFV